ncbi:hypothetical protein SUGI_0498290 [Cryptomeria japonica]|nr:hypothetical protein SUGI_0498290 [Cryptomeria japonica]
MLCFQGDNCPRHRKGCLEQGLQYNNSVNSLDIWSNFEACYKTSISRKFTWSLLFGVHYISPRRIPANLGLKVISSEVV